MSVCRACKTRGLYVNVNMKPSHTCDIKIFRECSGFGIGAFSRQKKTIQSRKFGIFSQIFHIFHHSNVFVIVKRLAENYVNLRAFDMYKFGCFENGHFSLLKTAESV